MRELWKSFKVVLFFLIFPVYAYSIELNEYGLNLNDFSELKEIRTLYISKQEGEDQFINPEEDFNNSNKIENYYLNNNFLSNETNTIYQYCCDSTDDINTIFVGKINDASEKFQSLESKDVFNLDNEIKVINLLVFQNKKLTKSVFIKDDKYNLLQADPEKQTYTLYLNSPLKFKDTISSVGEVQWSDFSITDFDLEVEFTPVYKSIQNLAEGIIVFKAPQLDIFLVADDRNNKIIYTDENLKKIKYHGDYDPNADITNPSSYLNPTLLNFLPTDLKKILDKGRELNSNYPLNYNLEELMELINDSEKLNANTIEFAKQKESELESIIQKKQAELKAKEDKANAEKLKAAQLEEQKAEEERQRILEQKAEEENQRMLAEQAEAEAAEKRKKYMQYGIIILISAGFIALAFLTNFLHYIKEFFNQIFGSMKKKRKSFLPKSVLDKHKKSQKKTGDWIADWANNQGSPKAAALMVTGISIFFGFILYLSIGEDGEISGLGWILAFLCVGLAMIAWKLWRGVFTYHCPKCQKIYVGEILSSKHIGSQQQARTYRVRDRRTVRYGKYQNKTDNYTVERDETGVEQIDTYHNKVKCKLCSHKWEYNSSTSTRVA